MVATASSCSLMVPVVGLLVVLAYVSPSSAAIQCYECNSSNKFTCTEFWDPNLVITEKYLTDCSHVFEANYCVKMTGIFDGKLGTKRFCSSKNWGNYCEYIKRPGDIQEYRSCVFSCGTNACNGGESTVFLSSSSKVIPWALALAASLIPARRAKVLC